ncbi:hypothetical protein BU16DRAFT_569140 [Lophium mytilinum]|uniref:Rhodanese domain-containing protein n=1 Tax=Lophium mytilinum TaxID=390894 RepID=A0A6A6REW1_9PEZI|nr:hypothetical protein BU16DRAFT_569140 [Lophium mytilinum]
MPPLSPYSPPPTSLSIAQILASARTHLTRLTPAAAAAELAQYHSHLQSQPPSQTPPPPPVLLIDIRPAAQRATEGYIAGATVIERNVLEWRLDPRSDARLEAAGGRYDARAIVICQEGYTSSLAARELQRLGLARATDVEGGYLNFRQCIKALQAVAYTPM